MNDRYYVFVAGRKRGPFSISQLLDEIEHGKVDYEDWGLCIGAHTCQKLHEILDWDETPLFENEHAPEEMLDTAHSDKPPDVIEIEADHEDADNEEDESANAPEDFEEDNAPSAEKSSQEHWQQEGHEQTTELEDEEFFDQANSSDDFPHEEPESYPEEHEEKWETSTQTQLPRDPNAILYHGRPSILSFPKSLLLTALSLALGIYFRELYAWVLFAGLALALLCFTQLQLRRMRHQFYITPKQAEAVRGLLLENSTEILIEEIGSIHIRRKGLQGLLGLATIEFSALDSPMPILAFHNIRSARRIKNLIRRIQDALDYSD